ncbi:hypothetical protein GCM10010911_39010 [Paenibacillus nasutitermitis]|uniref:Uncharacterized protein n=2 Tax=Paenibacillus nasutitermitis TaxID=1652958 RepID=A0A917DW65_9BACL|nr:hypothetical protein GCM10010911_39010 [Paenibacillus nasutitermitis]
MKKYMLIGAILLLLIVIGGGAYISRSKIMNPDNIHVREITVTEKDFTFKGDFMDAVSQYKGYKLEYDHQILYLQIKGGIFPPSKSRGSIDISVPNSFGEIREVQLQAGGSGANKTVWP